MKTFLVLYKATKASFDQAMKSTPDQQKLGMQKWMEWTQKAKSSIIEMGAPLGKAVKVDKSGAVTASPNDLGGYSILKGESKEAVADQMKAHPHFMMQEGWIEIVEILPVPGM